MTKLAAVARFALAEFGPLIVFWLLALAFGVKPAILGRSSSSLRTPRCAGERG
jgi:hypothetical protein